MTETGHRQIVSLATEIAGMVRRDGMHDFSATRSGTRATLCGLTVESQGDQLLRLIAVDLELTFDAMDAPANDHAGTRAPATARFRKGSPDDLKDWHSRLGQLHNFLAPVRRLVG